MTNRMLLAQGLLAVVLLSGCAAPRETPAGDRPSSTPVSVRGWIGEIELPPPPPDVMRVSDPMMELVRKRAMFRDTAISVEGVTYVSGGVGETGAFIMLDVPPGDVVLTFQPPNGPDARLKLRNLPGNADVILAGLVIKGANVVVGSPAEAIVRIPADTTERRKSNLKVYAGDVELAVWEVPLGELLDRRDYPDVKQQKVMTPTVR